LPSIYRVLRATDNDGQTGSASVEIQVTAGEL
jgi:hypothetical protein